MGRNRWYGAAWLTASCAPTMLPSDSEYVRSVVGRYAPDAKKIGYTAITARLEEMPAR